MKFFKNKVVPVPVNNNSELLPYINYYFLVNQPLEKLIIRNKYDETIIVDPTLYNKIYIPVDDFFETEKACFSAGKKKYATTEFTIIKINLPLELINLGIAKDWKTRRTIEVARPPIQFFILLKAVQINSSFKDYINSSGLEKILLNKNNYFVKKNFGLFSIPEKISDETKPSLPSFLIKRL